MCNTKVRIDNLEFVFSDSDVVNPDDAIFEGESNPHNVRGWLLHDHGLVLCVVFADCLQEALDIAADGAKLDKFLVTEDDEGNYDRLCYLGNAGEPFDIESLGYVEFSLPKESICRRIGPVINATKVWL